MSYKKGTKLSNGYVLGKGRTPMNLLRHKFVMMKNSKVTQVQPDS